MGGSCDDFVHRQNLERFRRQLASATDEAERRMLRKLLVEEECKEPRPNGREPDDECPSGQRPTGDGCSEWPQFRGCTTKPADRQTEGSDGVGALGPRFGRFI